MPLERRALLDRVVESNDSGVRRRELSRGVALSALLLRIECTNGATAGEEELFDAIDRVEVVDGSEVLFSLTGPELHRRQWVWLKKRPPFIRTQRASAVQEIALLIPFGRFIGDGELWLPTGNFQRPEVTIEFSPTISGTAFTTATFTITVIEYAWPSPSAAPPAVGWLRHRQIRDFTSLASGDEDIELSRQFPYMDAFIYAREVNVVDGTDITIVEVRENDGRVIPFRGRWLDIQMENQLMLDLVSVEKGVALQADNGTIDTLISRFIKASITMEQDWTADAAATGFAAIASVSADRITLALIDEDYTAAAPVSASNTAREVINWEAEGIGIGNAVLIPLAMPGDIRNPFPANRLEKLELRLTQGGAGATVRVSTTELVT